MKRKNIWLSVLAGIICLVCAPWAHASGEALLLSVNNGPPGGTATAFITIANVSDIESFSLTLYYSSGAILTLPSSNWFVRGGYFPSIPFATEELNRVQTSLQKKIYITGLKPTGTSGTIGAVTFNVSNSAVNGDTQVLSIEGEFYSKADNTIKQFIPGSATFTVGTSSTSTTSITTSTTSVTTSTTSMTTSTTTTVPPVGTPVAPSNLSALPVSASQINLSWADNSNNESGFKVERASAVNNAPGTFVQIGSTGANFNTFEDDGRNACTDYYYRVRAYNANGNSGYSNTASATTHGGPNADDKIRCMVKMYYRAILDRDPDQAGWDFWSNDISRITTDQGCQLTDKLGIYIGEGFQALARLHFTSTEYIAKGKNNTAFLTDCYEVFLERAPDAPGLSFWLNQMSQGYTRNMVITSFANEPEYKGLLSGYFGADTTRPENNLLNDLYRGILNRFPENDGFKFWLNLMRDAQCANDPVAMAGLCSTLAFEFTHSTEYANRVRNNSGFVEDLYNAILRRGADSQGFLFWVNALNGGTNRDTILQEFINGPEFQGRVQAVVAAGCCN